MNRKAAVVAMALVVIGAAFAARATPTPAGHAGKSSSTSALDKG